MTIIARHAGWNMRCRLPLHDAVVVTLHTTSRSNTIMREESRLPIRRAMATIAVHCSRQVVGGLK